MRSKLSIHANNGTLIQGIQSVCKSKCKEDQSNGQTIKRTCTTTTEVWNSKKKAKSVYAVDKTVWHGKMQTSRMEAQTDDILRHCELSSQSIK